jgi:hypothetical protein
MQKFDVYDTVEVTFKVKAHPCTTCGGCVLKNFPGFCKVKCFPGDHNYVVFYYEDKPTFDIKKYKCKN